MAILYIAAEGLELQHFADRMTAVRKLGWPLDFAYEGILHGRRVMLAANGAGPRLASHAAEVAIRAVSSAHLSASRLEAVVSTGFCGALDPALQLNDIVLGSQIHDSGSALTYDCILPSEAGPVSATGVVLSQDRVANSTAEKGELFGRGAIAVEMESAGVFSRCIRAGLPCFCIKVVSDRANESFGVDLNRMRSPEGRIARGKIVRSALMRPHIWPELLRLKRRAEVAAKVLGDFLVSCRILPDANDTVVG